MQTEETATNRENTTRPIIDGVEPVENGNPAAEAEAENASTGDAGEASDLLKKLDETTAALEEARERQLRLIAEMDNMRRRHLRDKEDTRKITTAGLLEDLLPVVDNFALGLQAARQHEGGDAFAQGFEMILGQLRSFLQQQGVEEINPKGEPFDPKWQESVAHLAHDEVAEGHVVSVERIGYRLGERLLRAAAVVVSKGSSSAEA